MKTLFKRISIHSLWIFLGLLALSLVIIDGPELRLVKVSSSGALENVVVTGEVVYTRGITARLFSGRRAMLFGTAQFETTIASGVYRSDELLEQIESGVVPVGETNWQVHWEMFPFSYLVIWLVIGLYTWLSTPSAAASSAACKGSPSGAVSN